MPTLAAVTLEDFTTRLFIAAGVPDADAATVATSLVGANLCGHDSHGVMRVPQYLGYLRDGTFKTTAALTVLNETAAVLAADAGWGLGQVQAHKLMSYLLPKANALGVATGTLRNCGHTGRLGEYAELAAKHRLAFFGTVNLNGSGRRVAPPGGTEGRISTNPICLGMPTSGEPMVLDFGTSVAAEGKVRVHYQSGTPCPPGWLADHKGHPTTDPQVLYTEPRGTILPFGGQQAYKGFGLGLLLDLFAGGLSGGACANPYAPVVGVGNAVMFTLFDPALFGGIDCLLKQADELTAYVRGCPLADPAMPITLPGDPERSAKVTRLRDGIPIPAGTWELLARMAEQYAVDCPTVTDAATP